MAEREQMELLGRAACAKVKVDRCLQPMIEGRYGNIHVDGAGWLVAVTDPSTAGRPRRWGNVKARLAFCELRQNGDSEGCLRLARLPSRAEGKLLRWAIGAAKVFEYAPEVLERKRRAVLACRRPLKATT